VSAGVSSGRGSSVPPRGPEPRTAARGPAGTARRIRAWAIWAATSLLVAALGLVGGVYYVGHRFSGRSQFAPALQTREMFQVAVSPEALFPGVERLNILCLGLDRNWTRKGMPYTKKVRSDTMIVLSLDLRERTVSALSIPRDSRVSIPGSGVRKINDAHQIGGVDLAIDTVREFLEIPIDYYVVVRIGAVERIVDALGGVDIDVEKDMKYDDNWGQLHIDLKKGEQRLTGKEIEGYMRFRHDGEGDFGRMRRQQQVLRAITQQVKSPAILLHLDRWIELLNENVDSNLTRTEMLALARMFYDVHMEQIETESLPARGVMIDEVSYLVVDEDRKKDLVDWLLRGDENARRRLTNVAVLNGCRSRRMTAAVTEQLRAMDYRARYVGGADRSDYAVTRILDHGHRAGAGRQLQEALQAGQVEWVKKEGGPDVTVIVGRDLSEVPAGDMGLYGVSNP
jgi:LCP family protein required for cell wall assembly